MNIAILGAGAWGTALAISLAPHHTVTLWARDASQLTEMSRLRRNPRYLDGLSFPPDLNLTAEFEPAATQAELIILAVPMAGLRPVLRALTTLTVRAPIVWLCKGFEADTARLPHQVVAEILPENHPCAVLSGPSFAREVAAGLPTALTLASGQIEFAKRIAHALHHPRLRIYASDDITGVEVGGAIKNVLAIAAGISDGLHLGNNARAALLTRGLAEITRLGLRLGGKAETLGGLSGVGDLILTCTGELSRNRQVGILLAQGKSLDTILAELGHVAEGVHTAREIQRITQRLQLEMPICETVYRVLYQKMPVHEAVEILLSRTPDVEF